MVVDTVEERALLDGLDVGFEGALHTHHPLLKERDDLQRWFPAVEDLVGRKPLPVSLGDTPVETTGRLDRGGKPQAVAIGVYVGYVAQIEVEVGENGAARGMAPFKRAPDSAPHDSVLFGRFRSDVLPTNASSVADIGELPTGELAAAVPEKTSQSPHGVHVGQETIDTLGGV